MKQLLCYVFGHDMEPKKWKDSNDEIVSVEVCKRCKYSSMSKSEWP